MVNRAFYVCQRIIPRQMSRIRWYASVKAIPTMSIAEFRDIRNGIFRSGLLGSGLGFNIAAVILMTHSLSFCA